MSTPVDGPRREYLDVLAATIALLRSDAVHDRWDDASVLEGMSVGAVAVHAATGSARAVLAVLEGPTPPGTRTLPAERLFVGVPLDSSDPVHQGVREQSGAGAGVGSAACIEETEVLADTVARELAAAPADRRITFLGLDMQLDAFLVTRTAELFVHLDDLARSVELPTPDVGPAATSSIAHLLVDTLRRRHGDVTVVRALAGRDPAAASILRVW